MALGVQIFKHIRGIITFLVVVAYVRSSLLLNSASVTSRQ